jgi:hypothetical protein
MNIKNEQATKYDRKIDGVILITCKERQIQQKENITMKENKHLYLYKKLSLNHSEYKRKKRKTDAYKKIENEKD